MRPRRASWGTHYIRPRDPQGRLPRILPRGPFGPSPQTSQQCGPAGGGSPEALGREQTAPCAQQITSPVSSSVCQKLGRVLLLTPCTVALLGCDSPVVCEPRPQAPWKSSSPPNHAPVTPTAPSPAPGGHGSALRLPLFASSGLSREGSQSVDFAAASSLNALVSGRLRSWRGSVIRSFLRPSNSPLCRGPRSVRPSARGHSAHLRLLATVPHAAVTLRALCGRALSRLGHLSRTGAAGPRGDRTVWGAARHGSRWPHRSVLLPAANEGPLSPRPTQHSLVSVFSVPSGGCGAAPWLWFWLQAQSWYR